MAFLHGVEALQIQSGVRPITQARSGVIALIGTAPIGPINEPTVITNQRQAGTIFGAPLPNFTIPQALKAIFDQGAGLVVVINVFDPDDTDLTATVTAETKTITDGKATLTYAPVSAVVLTNNAGSTTYVNGTDYSVDEYGVITVLDFGEIAEGSTVKATYDRIDTAGIDDALIIGEDEIGEQTGLQCLDIIRPTFGYGPKIIVCPTYCEEDAVAAEMIVKANSLKAFALIDAPEETTHSEAIAARGVSGTLAGFTSASNRVILCYPHVKKYDIATDATVNYPFSPYLAGVMSATDNRLGYWFSPSNKEIQGILGTEFTFTSELNDENSDVNLLNAVGITTLFQGYGTGIRTWGNRSAAYPTTTTPDVFIPVNRVRDILEESVVQSSLQFVDLPITSALIDSITESVNAFIRSLIQRGALVDGECLYIPEDNPAEEIAAGHLTFQINFMPPTPAERITFSTFLDISLLNTLNAE